VPDAALRGFAAPFVYCLSAGTATNPIMPQVIAALRQTRHMPCLENL